MDIRHIFRLIETEGLGRQTNDGGWIPLSLALTEDEVAQLKVPADRLSFLIADTVEARWSEIDSVVSHFPVAGRLPLAQTGFVLLGDYLLAKGLLLSVENNEHELLRLVSDAVREMSEGELLQIQKSRKLNITKVDYFEIIRKKTATLFAACTACGAWSSSQDPVLTEKMKIFGEKVGMAFQIKDDLFDYHKKGLIGKPTGNDIKEKKFTLPLIHALDNSTDSERKHIIRTIKKHNNNSKICQNSMDCN